MNGDGRRETPTKPGQADDRCACGKARTHYLYGYKPVCCEHYEQARRENLGQWYGLMQVTDHSRCGFSTTKDTKEHEGLLYGM